MNNNNSHYIIGALIALAFYVISQYIGSFFNVIVAAVNGASFSEFMDEGSIAGALMIILFSLANHLFFAWVTTNAMTKYGRKHNCITKWYFDIAATTVFLYSAIISPILFSSSAGWLSWAAHSFGILYFGKKQYVKATEESLHFTEFGQVNRGFSDNTTGSNGENELRFCFKCGKPIVKGSSFCPYCGQKIS